MLTAIIPDPHGAKRFEAYGNDAADLAGNVRAFIMEAGYGASDIGSKFNVFRDGRKIGFVAYNGKVRIND